MAISKETVLSVARLARLELGEEEVTRMQRDLAKILGYVEELAKLPTDDVPETAQVGARVAPLRADEAVPSLPTDVTLGEAPRRADGGFAVPAFVDE